MRDRGTVAEIACLTGLLGYLIWVPLPFGSASDAAFPPLVSAPLVLCALTALVPCRRGDHPTRHGFLWTCGGALFIASIGNPIYTVANQTALVEAADASNRGSVMASRFSLVMAAGIAGTATGGFITQAYGPLAAYGVLAVGLILLGLFALAAGRRITNPLHGREYEESVQIAFSQMAKIHQFRNAGV